MRDNFGREIRVSRDSFRREIRVLRDYGFRREIRVLRDYERVKNVSLGQKTISFYERKLA